MSELHANGLLTRQRRLHFVGIGGAGMSGIAELCLKLGMRVSGCDLKPSPTITRLASLGAEISQGHHPAHLKDDGGIDAVVISSAIKFSNPEVARAREMKIPVIARAEMLGELLRMAKLGVAVAGTHGKTTTTGLIALIMEEADLDPTVAVGGNIRNTGSNVRLGRGDFMVAEADESDASFLLLIPTIAVVTNIDPEHLDHYGTMDKVREAFADFINRVPFYGVAVLGIDSVNVRGVDGVDSQADGDLRRRAGRGSARRENRDRRPLDPLRGDSQGRTSRARDDTDAGRARCAELARGDRGRDGSWNQFRSRGVGAREVRRDQPPLRDQGRSRRTNRARRLCASSGRSARDAGRRARVVQAPRGRGLSAASIHPPARFVRRFSVGVRRRRRALPVRRVSRPARSRLPTSRRGVCTKRCARAAISRCTTWAPRKIPPSASRRARARAT